MKTIVILAIWKDKEEMKQLKNIVKNTLGESYKYCFLLGNLHPTKNQELPYLEDVYFFSKKDFSWFGRIKNSTIKAIVNEKNSNVLVTIESAPHRLLNRLIKQSKLTSIGMKKTDLPEFDVSFPIEEEQLESFLQQLKVYLPKIKIA